MTVDRGRWRYRTTAYYADANTAASFDSPRPGRFYGF
jgi:hypothetical protein